MLPFVSEVLETSVCAFSSATTRYAQLALIDHLKDKLGRDVYLTSIGRLVTQKPSLWRPSSHVIDILVHKPIKHVHKPIKHGRCSLLPLA